MSSPQPHSPELPKTPEWSRLGFGTGTLASLGRAASLADVDRLLGTMREIGMTVIDTADTYGSGDCERLLGKVLRGRRDSFILATKAGYRLADLPGPLRPLNQLVKKSLQRLGDRQCFAPEYLSKCVDRSLSRLGVDHLDAFLLHNPPMHAVMDPKILNFCAVLIESGKTSLTGLSSENPEIIRAAVSTGIFRIIQTPASLKIATTLRPVWKECAANGIRLVGNHVFDPACLGAPGMTHEILMRGASALLPKDSTLLCGTRNPGHLRQSCQWADHPLAEEDALRMIHQFAF
jgi:aryl-alcohol dehydrogenase-like predicted oxidoreductase